MGRTPGSTNKPKNNKPSSNKGGKNTPSPAETVTPAPKAEETKPAELALTEPAETTVETAEATPSVQNEAETAPVVETPPAAPESRQAPKQEVAPSEAESRAPQATAPVNLGMVKPTSAHSDEEKLEAFLKIRNNPKTIGHVELMSSGINMMKVGLLDAKIGRYKFTRRYVADIWSIEIV